MSILKFRSHTQQFPSIAFTSALHGRRWFNSLDDKSQIDPTGEGIVGLLRYAFGVGANEQAVAKSPLVGTKNLDGEEYLTITFRRLNGIPTVDYVVECSDDLATWKATAVQVGSAMDAGKGMETVTYRDSVPMRSAEKRFIRVCVVPK